MIVIKHFLNSHKGEIDDLYQKSAFFKIEILFFPTFYLNKYGIYGMV